MYSVYMLSLSLSSLYICAPHTRSSQISQHPWFVQNLPPDALAMNANFLANADYSVSA